jgi:hypothetical protein
MQYLSSTGEGIDENELVQAALGLVTDVNKSNALLNLHIRRIWLSYRTMAFVDEYVELITHVAKALRDELLIRRLYLNNVLPFRYEELLGDRLLLCTNQAYADRILRELSNTHSPLL